MTDQLQLQLIENLLRILLYPVKHVLYIFFEIPFKISFQFFCSFFVNSGVGRCQINVSSALEGSHLQVISEGINSSVCFFKASLSYTVTSWCQSLVNV